jgi:hypothetical protein
MKSPKIKNFANKVISEVKDAYSVAKNADAKAMSNPGYYKRREEAPGVMDAFSSLNEKQKIYDNTPDGVGKRAAKNALERERGFYEAAVNRAKESAAANKAKKGK